MALLERDEPLARLDHLLERARLGEGSLVLVAGEAGAGKTSLVREFVRRHRDQAIVLSGACDPLTTPRPLGPLLDMAADPDSGLRELRSDDLDGVDRFAVVLERLKGSLRPIIMIVEDIHWGDDATLDMLRFLGRRIEDTNAVLVTTFRDDEVGAEHPLRTLLGQLGPLAATQRVDVDHLSSAAVATLAAGSGIDVTQLYDVTGGNAFFVTEVIAAGEQLPETVQDAVLARVGRLDRSARSVVEAVSIAPRSLELEHLGALAGATAQDVDTATTAGVLIETHGALRFRHELARVAVETSIPTGRRLQMHRRMLGLLSENDPADLARLAHHAIRAIDVDLIIEHAPAAAREAAERGSHKQAAAFFQAVLEHEDRLDADVAAAIRLEAAAELSIIGRHDEALMHAELAIGHYRKHDAPEDLARALVVGSGRMWLVQRIADAVAAGEEAIALLEPLGPSWDLANALYISAYHSMLARQLEPAASQTQRVLHMAREVGAEDMTERARLMDGTVEIVLGDPQRGADVLRDVKRRAETAGNRRLVMTSLGMLGSGGGEARRYADALPALAEGIEVGLAADEDYNVGYCRAWLARIAFEQGRWDDATEFADLVADSVASRTGISMVTAMGALGRTRVRRGDPGGVELLLEYLEPEDRHEIQHVWSLLCGVAERAWLLGRGGDIEGILARGYQRALGTDSTWARGEVGFWMWKGGAIDGPPDHAAEPFALQMAGDWRGAADAWRHIGCPYEVGLALLDGDAAAVTAAVAIFDDLGARPAAGLARTRLKELGAKSIPRGPARSTQENPAGLTNRQLEVLRLMVAGMSNGEIADELFVSKKTVEHHVSAVLSKLGAPTRAKAIAAATDLGVGQK